MLGKSTVFEHYINKQKNKNETTKTQEKRGIKKTQKINKTKRQKTNTKQTKLSRKKTPKHSGCISVKTVYVIKSHIEISKGIL